MPNYQITHDFLIALGNGETRFTFQTFDDNKERRNSFLARVFNGTLEEHQEELTQLNSKGAGVFVNVCQTDLTGRGEENITGIRALFIDCDAQLPTSYHLQPSIIVQSSSSNKGHAYWLLDETVFDLESFEPAQKALIKHYNTDKCIHNLSRVMRLPGFYHMKDEPFQVTVLELNDKRYSINDVVSSLPSPVAAVASTSNSRKDGAGVSHLVSTAGVNSNDLLVSRLQEQVTRVMDAKQGSRNTTLNEAAYVVGQLVPYGLDESEARRKLQAAAMLVGLGDVEISATLNSGIGAGKLKPVDPTSAGVPKSKHKKLLTLVSERYAERLQWDVMKLQPMLDGVTVEMSDIEYEIVNEHDIDVDFQKLTRIVFKLAKEKPYNPVTAYLEQVSERVTPAVDVLNRLTREAMGLTDPLECRYVTRWLVGAVARAMKPGCKNDTALILQGSQGYRKTTFFQTLFGDDYFMTLGENANERDDLMTMYKNWAVEWGEFEVAAGRKGISEMKNFMSRQRDEFRAPYAATVSEYQRHFVLCGSTNKQEFLYDETGNRRFWVTHIPQPINTQWVEQHRDEIWSAAVALYKAGEQWWLTDTEQTVSNDANAAYEAESPWETLVSRWLSKSYTANDGIPYDGNPFTTADVLTNAIGKPAGQWNRKDENEVGRVMKRLGYEQKRLRLGGKCQSRYWVSDAVNDTPTISSLSPTYEYF